ncbi:rho/rac/cdc gtpase-activating protein [Anaeramoeba ignava]|uniref:Rho/rac/cdc gtpase-activating protein n=1 Tax=Anaeramoeba ignava TaxID=1746090 RepID=A0A9Q0LL42_ANAIG|nr:rho/rac/cdc gtpase-activating protein [Anaeramoeba ignava]
MAVTLWVKVVFPYEQTTKIFGTSPIKTVKELKEMVCEAEQITNSFEYGLYCTSGNGFWMNENQTLISYEIWRQESIEFKKKRIKKVNINYGAETKLIEMNEEEAVSKQIKHIIKEFGLTENYTEFDLFVSENLLDRTKTLLELEIKNIGAAIFKLKRKTGLIFQRSGEMNVGLKPIFGYYLDNAIQRGKREVPVVIEKICSFIEVKGIDIYGIYGKTGVLSKIEDLKELFDKSDDIQIEEITKSPHDVASLLKLYLNELPEPLIPWKFYDSFISSDEIQEIWLKMKKFRTIVSSIPKSNYKTLLLICQHLNKVSKHSQQNNMNSKNLSIVFGSLLLKDPRDSKSSLIRRSTVSLLTKSHNDLDNNQSRNLLHIYSCCQALIDEYEYIFGMIEKNFSEKEYAVAIYDFEGTHEEDLSLIQGDYVEIITKFETNDETESNENEQEKGGWWKVKSLKTKEIGLVPYNYIEIVKDYVPQAEANENNSYRKALTEMDSLKIMLAENIELRTQIQTKKENLLKRIAEFKENLQVKIDQRRGVELIVKKIFGENAI